MIESWLSPFTIVIGGFMVPMFFAVGWRAWVLREHTKEMEDRLQRLAEIPPNATAAALRTHMDEVMRGSWLYEPFYEWWEQTWVDGTSEQGQLRNALQSGDFLDLETVRPHKVSVAETFPGLLTALGILGTFLGIAYGLSGVNLAAEDVVGEITPLLGGLKTAFGTSILGLFLSMVSTLTLSLLSNRFNAKRLKLIRWLDAKVDRTTSQDLLRNVVDQLRLSNEQAETQAELQRQVISGIQGLEHDIGSALEQSIQRSGLVQAVENMAAQVARTQTEGVGKIVDQFSEQLGERFADQFDKLGGSLDDMVQANTEYQTQMSSVVTRLEQTVAAQSQAADKARASLQHANEAAASLENAANSATRAAEAIAASGQESAALVQQQNDAASRLTTTLDGQSHSVAELTSAVDGLRQWHAAIAGSLKQQLETWTAALAEQRGLTSDIAGERKHTSELIEALRQASGGIQAVQASLGQTTGELKAQLETTGQARMASVNQLESAGRSLAELEAKISSSLTTFERTAELLSANTTAVQASLSSLTSAAKGQDDIVSRTQEVAKSLRESVEAQKTFSASISQAASQAEKVAQLSASLSQAAIGLTGIDQKLANTSRSLATAAEQLTSRDREAEKTWALVTAELRQTSGDLTAGMARYSEQVNSSVSSTAKDFGDLMAKAVGDLSTAAGSLSTAINELEDVVEALAETQ